MEEQKKHPPHHDFFLSEVIGAHIYLQAKNIGKLSDIIIVEHTKIPEVSHILVSRPFGDPSLLIPWGNVVSVTPKSIAVDIDDLSIFEKEPEKHMILLKDHVMDKKVIDIEGREVDVVYDVKLRMQAGKLFVTDADFSRSGLLRRMGLARLANIVYQRGEKREQTTSWMYIQPLPKDISSFQGDIQLRLLKEKLADVPPVDVADILEELNHEQRLAVFNQLEPEKASDTLEEVDPTVQRDLVSSLKKEKVARLIKEMTPGQAADVLAVLPSSDANAILQLLDPQSAKKIEAILQRDEERAQNFATTHFIKLSSKYTVQQTIAEYQQLAKDKKVIMYIYIVDNNDTLLGVVDLKELLQSENDVPLKEIMTENVITLDNHSTLLEASEQFEHYGFRAIPLVDEKKHIIGVVPYRDVMNLKHHFLK